MMAHKTWSVQTLTQTELRFVVLVAGDAETDTFGITNAAFVVDGRWRNPWLFRFQCTAGA